MPLRRSSPLAVPILLAALTLAPQAAAQPYTAAPAPFAPAVWSTLALGDADGDGDLDVLLSGFEVGLGSTVRLYRNEGPADAAGAGVRLTPVEVTLPGVEGLLPSLLGGLRAPTIRWADFDGDGDLDLLVASGDRAVIYRHGPAFIFTAMPLGDDPPSNAAALPPEALNTPSAAWGDADGDGDLDALVAGPTGTKLLRNDGDAFARLPAGLPALANAVVSWADVDGDGDLDVLASTRMRDGASTILYRNDDGRYVRVVTPLPGVEQGTATWADIDADGDLDVLVTGGPAVGGGGPSAAMLYRNDGGTFVRTDDALPSAWYGRWLDADADGDVDLLLLSGNGARGTTLHLFTNDGGRFSDADVQLPGIWLGALAAGDLTGDGRPDLLMTGQVRAGGGGSTGTLLYVNAGTAPVPTPAVPTALRSRRTGDTYVFEWSGPEAPAGALAGYAVRVGTAPGRGDVVAAHATAGGARRLPGPGRSGERLVLTGLDTTATYYWSVQTVHPAGIGSAFAPEATRPPESAHPPLRPRRFPGAVGNYPDPFNPSTTIHFRLAAPADVRLTVYDALGAEVSRLARGRYPAGQHQVTWTAHDAAGRILPSGVYLYALDAGGERTTGTMILSK